MQLRFLAVTGIAASLMLALKMGSLAFGDPSQSRFALFHDDTAVKQTMPAKVNAKASQQAILAPVNSSDLSVQAEGTTQVDAQVLTGQIAENIDVMEHLGKDETPNIQLLSEGLFEGKETYKPDVNNPIYQNNETISYDEVNGNQIPSETKQALEARIAERQNSKTAAQGDNMQQRLLQAAENKLSARIEELKQAQDQLDATLIQKENEKEQQFAGLVKMYESMRPKNAARIFNTLDMAVLLDVSKRMKPRIMAEIMAYMEPESAQALTIAIAHGASALSSPSFEQQNAPKQNDVTGSISRTNNYDNLPKIGE